MYHAVDSSSINVDWIKDAATAQWHDNLCLIETTAQFQQIPDGAILFAFYDGVRGPPAFATDEVLIALR